MELTDLNLDAISHICDRLKLVDLTMLSCTCSSLRMLYPDVEIKQYSRMLKVLVDINSINYEVKKDQFSTKSIRIFGDVSVEYTLHTMDEIRIALVDNRGLFITYKFASDDTRDKDECIFDGGYIDVDKYRRFRTKIDRRMWYAEYDIYGDDSLYLYRRRFPTAPTIYVTVEGNVQLIYIADGIPEFEELDAENGNDDVDSYIDSYFDIKYLPPWADKS